MTSTDSKRDADMKEAMDAAMAALKSAVPDLPIMRLVAFPTADPETTCICSGANVPKEQQRVMLSIALDGVELNEHQSTAH